MERSGRLAQARALLSASIVAACFGCEGDELHPNGEFGDLGRGHFAYDCFGETDPQCSKADSPGFPEAVAVGGRFDMEFTAEDGKRASVIAASDGSVQERAGGFEVLRSGFAAMLGVNGNLEVLDMIHLRAARIEAIKVLPDGELPVSDLVLEVEMERELRAIPYDGNDVVLSGSLDYRWESTNAAVVRVETLDTLHRAHLRALSPGSATLAITAGGVRFGIDIRVEGDADHDVATIRDAGAVDLEAQ